MNNMFDKKCFRCRNNIKSGFDFCPFCGNSLKTLNNSADYGLLGKNDFVDETMFSEMNGSFMDRIFNNAFKMAEKMIEKQMKTMAEEIERPRNKVHREAMPGVNMQFFVNGKRVFPNSTRVIKSVRQIPEPARIENHISEEKMRKFLNLPRKEPDSRVRRLAGKIIYELEMPGVENLDDVMINRLENSIEVKGISNDKIYHKTLNVNLPILRYGLNNGCFILELVAR